MKRYFIFACDHYYPNGGLGDLIADFDTIEEVDVFQSDTKYDYYEVLDTQLRLMKHSPNSGDQWPIDNDRWDKFR